MRLLNITSVFLFSLLFFSFSLTHLYNSGINYQDKNSGAYKYQKPEITLNKNGEYILHKKKIDADLELLKNKFPELKTEIMSYKFLFTPMQSGKQQFESDANVFKVLKMYSQKSKPGDKIAITGLKYKALSDQKAEWKFFESKLLFVFE